MGYTYRGLGSCYPLWYFHLHNKTIIKWIYFWEEIKPLKADGFSSPVVPSELLSNEYEAPNHMELGYMSGDHYNSVVSMITNKVPEHIPQKQTPALADITNVIVIN